MNFDTRYELQIYFGISEHPLCLDQLFTNIYEKHTFFIRLIYKVALMPKTSINFKALNRTVEIKNRHINDFIRKQSSTCKDDEGKC